MQTIRLLNPRLTAEASTVERDRKLLTQGLVQSAAITHAQAFLTGPAKLLVPETHRNLALTKVRELYVYAGELAIELWTRTDALKVSSLEDLGGEVRFSMRNEIMVPHPLVKVDDGFEGLSMGAPVAVLVQPLLELCGDEQGRRFDGVKRVLAPAEVWCDT